ncbi:uncharacterized protein LOC114204508 [Eumetopias jubatus]|uniref:uncharacterized protein LOC114204508 n=1 Tax=Eumetopias jubatus TaxID=34886 RepID=UPI0010164DD8|nr:uncharacterized protein LOC114204508 [Eumetopias jubatus]
MLDLCDRDWIHRPDLMASAQPGIPSVPRASPVLERGVPLETAPCPTVQNPEELGRALSHSISEYQQFLESPFVTELENFRYNKSYGDDQRNKTAESNPGDMKEKKTPHFKSSLTTHASQPNKALFDTVSKKRERGDLSTVTCHFGLGASGPVSRLAIPVRAPLRLPRRAAALATQTCGLSRKLFTFSAKEKRPKSARLRRLPNCALPAPRRGHSCTGRRRRRCRGRARGRRSPAPVGQAGAAAAGQRGTGKTAALGAGDARRAAGRRAEAGGGLHAPFESPSWADDEHRARRRTHRPALARRCVQGARGSPGPSPARPAFRLLRSLRSRHLGGSAPASRLRPKPPPQRGSRPRSCLFKWWGQRAAPAAAAWVAPRAAIEGRTKMAAALAV